MLYATAKGIPGFCYILPTLTLYPSAMKFKCSLKGRKTDGRRTTGGQQEATTVCAINLFFSIMERAAPFLPFGCLLESLPNH